MNKFTKQCVAAFASLAMAGTLCVAGAVVANNVAFASGGAQTTPEPAPWDTSAAQKTGTIKITKYKDEGTNQKNTKIQGATFKISKVDTIDNAPVTLTTKDGWVNLAKKVKALNGETGTKPTVTTSAVTDGEKATNSEGEATFSGLAIGLYKVEEVAAAPDYSNDVAPFYMTVPQITRTANNTNNTYTYDITVDPKNAYIKDNVTKTADTTKMVGAGDDITYTISAKLNKTKSTNGKDLTKDDLQDFTIYDDVLTNAYETVDTSIVTEVKIKDEQTAMSATDDYSVSEEDGTANNGIGADRKRIKVTFKTEDNKGINKIVTKANTLDANPVEILVTVKLKLKSDLSSFIGSDKKLENKSGFIPGHSPNIDPKPTPGGSAKTEFRKFHIFKYDGTTEKGTSSTDGRKALKGAQFKAFADKTEAEKCAKDPDGTDTCKNAMTGFVDAKNTTAGDNGTITTTGKDGKTTDYVAKVTDTNSKIYLVEVKAPEGYTRSEQAYEVNLESKASTANDAVLEYEVPNVPDNKGDFWFKLPKTGAAGVTIFAIAGMGLVGIGIFVFMRNRKKDEEHQNA
ncbi:SpaH/EbpB family LPXTG-anchored major pilin [Gardnerella sp. KA00747]|uniref:SpaH/EbpB family LPXTG-anchored major pilin n=1 Tax=Gardnerella sp. KA00747 TaxID=2749078 RepID=UPI003BA95DF6